MAAYVIAELTIHDRDRYDRYVAGFLTTLAGFDGRLLAADEAPIVAEGSGDHEKVVLLEFRDVADSERWASSPAYTRIAKDRRAATTGRARTRGLVDVSDCARTGGRRCFADARP